MTVISGIDKCHQFWIEFRIKKYFLDLYKLENLRADYGILHAPNISFKEMVDIREGMR